VLDYHVYDKWPGWLRRLEEKLRLDLGLAIAARRMGGDFDIIWCWSEKVGIPLSFMGVRKPMIVVCHHPSSRYRKLLARFARVAEGWAGVGYVSDDDKEVLLSQYHVANERLFRILSAPLDRFPPPCNVTGGPIISLGVAKRDYATLIAALEQLPGRETEIYTSSLYGDRLRGSWGRPTPSWVHRMDRVADDELTQRYRRSRFVVLPLLDTTHSSAGSTVALEAGAAGKAIIATRTFGTPTFVKDGETGILVPPYDVAAWRDAIELLWCHPDLAYEMGCAGRKYVEAAFDPAKMHERIGEIVQSLAAGTRCR
jgi:glycosyltransferase involved in cell wall biosynthesis